MRVRIALGWLLLASLVHAAEIRGKVTNVIGGEPLARVLVSVLDTNYKSVTSADGTFTIKDLKPGNYVVRFEAVGYRLVALPFSIVENEQKEFEVNLAPDNFRRTESVVVTGDVFRGPDPPGVNQMILTSSELKEGSTVLADDPFRAIQSLPGVSPAGNNELYAEFSVTGAPFSTIGVYLDDVLIPSPFHSIPNELNGASLSLLTSETVQEMKLYPVAYPEKFGDETGAALDIRTRDGSNGKPSFRVAPGIADSEFLGEGGLGQAGRGSWLTSVRKSYIGWIVRNRVGPDFSDISFYDGDAKFTYDVAPGQHLSLYGLAGHTNVEVAQPGFPQALKRGATDFYLGRLGWRWSISPHLLLDNRLAFVRDPYSETFLDGTQMHSSYKEWSGGSNLVWNWDSNNLLDAGWTLRREANPSRGYYLGNGYVQHTSSLLKHHIHFSGGLRLDETPHSTLRPFSPQAAVAFVRGSTTFEVAYGRYVTISPTFIGNFPSAGCPYIAQNWTAADHTTAGIEQRFGENTRVRVQVFNRHYHDTFHQDVTPCGQGQRTAFTESFQRGYSQGAQLIIQRRSANRLSGWIGYTLVSARQSIRMSAAQALEIFSPYYSAAEDQRHSVNAFAMYHLKPTINVSGKFLFGSGFPILSGTFIVDSNGNVRPAPTVRLDPYMRVDARVDKSWASKRWKLTLYTEVLNLTNHYNRIVTSSYYTPTGQLATTTAQALPITPTAGLAIEF